MRLPASGIPHGGTNPVYVGLPPGLRLLLAALPTAKERSEAAVRLMAAMQPKPKEEN